MRVSFDDALRNVLMNGFHRAAKSMGIPESALRSRITSASIKDHTGVRMHVHGDTIRPLTGLSLSSKKKVRYTILQYPEAFVIESRVPGGTMRVRVRGLGREIFLYFDFAGRPVARSTWRHFSSRASLTYIESKIRYALLAMMAERAGKK